MGTLVVSLILAVLFGLAIRSIYRDKKAGGGCSGCSGCSGGCGAGSACSCASMQQMASGTMDAPNSVSCQHL